MGTQFLIPNKKAEEQLSVLVYQAPVIIELEISQLVQSATNVMSESNSGYYS